jgi:predicted exporter
MSVSARGAYLTLAIWALLIACAGYVVSQKMEVGSDLRLFLPPPENRAERILLEELKEGPGTRVLLVSLSGAPQAELASASAQLAESLRSNQAFTRIENGILHTEAGTEKFAFDHRYLLTPRASGCACDPQSLRDELGQRLDELGSPAGGLAQDVLLRDPTGEIQAIIDAWLPANEPQLIDGVWFSKDAKRALLMLQTRGAGFDADQQHIAIDAIHTALAQRSSAKSIKLEITGPGAFTALLEKNTRDDINLLGIVESIGSLAFLFLVLRSLRNVVLSSLVLATAGVAALLGVLIIFKTIHGITLAFGFTLLGVAMDYPVHLMLHVDEHLPPKRCIGHVWPTLRLSIITTCIAYMALVFTGFTGLAQLGVFTTCGLLATAIVIRYIAPSLIAEHWTRPLPAWVLRVEHGPSFAWLPWGAIVVAIGAIAFSRSPLWDNNLGSLTPVPQDLQALDVTLREEIGAPDLRYLLAVSGPDAQQVLQRDEALRSQLDGLVAKKLIAGYEQPSNQLPSIEQQQQRQRQLPDSATLKSNLQQALKGMAFRSDSFDGFISDVEAARHARPVTPQDLAGTALADGLSAKLFAIGPETIGLITLSGVRDADALGAWAQSTGQDVLLIDLKTMSENLVERFRARALLALGVAMLLIAALLIRQLNLRAAIAVVLPVIATVLSVVAFFKVIGISLTLFHIVSLLLVGGLCFDYGLFFNRREESTAEHDRTRFAVMVCWVSTSFSFGLLTLSSLPVLKAIGFTVAGGVTCGFFLAYFSRHEAT